ncbi:DUF4279 domain-containing protein [Spirillospora sp. NPDC127200]
MYLRLVSETLPVAEISERLGADPDQAWERGSRRRPEAPPRDHTLWARHAEVPESDPRPEHLEPVVLGWGGDFARAVGELVAAGDAAASLEIVQEIRDIDDHLAKGIFLRPEMLEWLATARASLDIDQYIYHECPGAEDE